jgi:glycosyltransferase involved in cell wall biosynthesis
VDTQLFGPKRRSTAMRARLAGGEVDAPLIVTAARLSPEKSIHRLRELLEARPDARLAIVGDGPARADLERHFEGSPTVFTGFLRGEELASAFASGDVFVVPSTTETLGFVVLEAMASGRPVVAARAGGIPDLIRDGEDGLLYDPDEPGALVKQVEAVLGSRTHARFLGEQARKSAERVSWAKETRDLAWVYRRAIKAHATSGVLGRVRHALRS